MISSPEEINNSFNPLLYASSVESADTEFMSLLTYFADEGIDQDAMNNLSSAAEPGLEREIEEIETAATLAWQTHMPRGIDLDISKSNDGERAFAGSGVVAICDAVFGPLAVINGPNEQDPVAEIHGAYQTYVMRKLATALYISKLARLTKVNSEFLGTDMTFHAQNGAINTAAEHLSKLNETHPELSVKSTMKDKIFLGHGLHSTRRSRLIVAASGVLGSEYLREHQWRHNREEARFFTDIEGGEKIDMFAGVNDEAFARRLVGINDSGWHGHRSLAGPRHSDPLYDATAHTVPGGQKRERTIRDITWSPDEFEQVITVH